MKETYSFSLEEDVINKIKEYQKNNNLSSRSVALERIVLGFKGNTIDDEYIESIVKKYIGLKDNKNITPKSKKDKIDTAISDSFNNMQD